MADRFVRLFELPSNLHSVGSPVIISAGALLKDSQTGSMVVQLKFQSVSLVTIKALRIDIAAFDVAGNELQGKTNFQYLDLLVQNGQTFGSNKAIVLPDETTRSFSISNLSVVFTDGKIYTAVMPMSELPKPIPLYHILNNSELVKQYQLAVNSNARYAPQVSNGMWGCSCGTWNSGKECQHCGANKYSISEAFDVSDLTKKMELRLAEQKYCAEVEKQNKAEQSRLEIEAREAKTKKKKILIAITGISLILLSVMWIICGSIPNLVDDGVTIRTLCLLLWTVATFIIGTMLIVRALHPAKDKKTANQCGLAVTVVGLVSFVIFYVLTYT